MMKFTKLQKSSGMMDNLQGDLFSSAWPEKEEMNISGQEMTDKRENPQCQMLAGLN